MTYVKCNSHRAREKMVDLLGEKPPEYYNLAFNYHLFEIPESMLEDVLNITGVSKGKFKSQSVNGYLYQWQKTWSVK